MIIPIPNQKSHGENVGKWYLTYRETYKDLVFCRYFHPTGWEKFCYYWDDYDEMMRVFNKIGQNRLVVTDEEYTDEKFYRDEYQILWHEDAMRELESHIDNETKCGKITT
jgi:hypothetical protein